MHVKGVVNDDQGVTLFVRFIGLTHHSTGMECLLECLDLLKTVQVTFPLKSKEFKKKMFLTIDSF